MDKKTHLVTKAWAYFTLNFSAPNTFVKYICEKTNKMYLYDHLLKKFDKYYYDYGARAAMISFYVELDEDLRAALADYAVKEYFPHAFYLTEDEKQILGI